MSDIRNEFDIFFKNINEVYGRMSLVLNGFVRLLLGEHLLGNEISEAGMKAISEIINLFNLEDCSLEDCFDDSDNLVYSAMILSEVSSKLMEARLDGSTDSLKGITNIYELFEIIQHFREWFAYESELLIEEGSDENDSE